MKKPRALKNLAGILSCLPGAGIVRKGINKADSKTRPYQLMALLAVRTAIDRQIERLAETPVTSSSASRSESIEIE
ncbi:MAG: hypothetical protein QMD09_15190 [Desulfatibacillaceae bacterium]|nr:hypothetical protein [Desulfatibacillaceae bacterium]